MAMNRTESHADVILWCTGFRSSFDHLAPLQLREDSGGIGMTGRLATQVAKETRASIWLDTPFRVHDRGPIGRSEELPRNLQLSLVCLPENPGLKVGERSQQLIPILTQCSLELRQPCS